MPLVRRRRQVPADRVNLARSRVEALSSRRGWVPRVPVGAGPAEGAVEASAATSPGRHARPADPSAEPTPPRSDTGAGDTEELTGLADAFGEGIPAEATQGAIGSAITDRLPLPVRAVIDGLPSGVRHGRAGLQPTHAAVVVLVVLLGLAVTALVTGLGRPRIDAIEPAPTGTILATGTQLAAPDEVADAGVETRPEELVVHVAGKVAKPGIVTLPAGSRVIDAIEAAGGAEGGVDLTPLNLARVLNDGEQVVVGIDPPPQAAPGDGQSGPSAVSLNSATAEQLATLPGIGPTLAARIVQWREQNGRFTTVDELLEVSGIGPAKYDAIAGLVTL